MLLRRRALAEAGGIAAIRGGLIDDVALAGEVKRRPGGGRIWLGLGNERLTSLRAYQRLGAIWAMVARKRRHEARTTRWLLLAPLLGMVADLSRARRSPCSPGLIHGDAVTARARRDGGLAHHDRWSTGPITRLYLRWWSGSRACRSRPAVRRDDRGFRGPAPARRRRALEGPRDEP